jgi:hypothetical protein
LKEVLHVHPAADVVSAQDDRLTGTIDDLGAPHGEERVRHPENSVPKFRYDTGERLADPHVRGHL